MPRTEGDHQEERAAPRARRIVIADASRITRAGVRVGLAATGFAVCGEAEDAVGAVEAVLRCAPELCVLDVELPGDGLAAAREITERSALTRTVLLTARLDGGELLAAVSAGAVGYLAKDIEPEPLGNALLGVLAGEAAISRRLVPELLHELRATRLRRRPRVRPALPVALSAREWEVLEGLREGLGTREVAGRLGISTVTVRRHASSAVRKLGVHDRDAAVAVLARAAAEA